MTKAGDDRLIDLILSKGTGVGGNWLSVQSFGAEILDDKVNTQGMKPVQQVQHRLFLRQQGAHGDFNLQSLRGKPGHLQRRFDDFEKLVAVSELHG